MSKYLDFIATKITKQDKHEAAIALGSALVATVIAKHFMNKKEIEDQDPWAEGDDYAFIEFAQQEPSYQQEDMFDDKTQPYSFMQPSMSNYDDPNSTVPRIGTSLSYDRHEDSDAEEEISFLDQATEQFDPFEDEFTYDTSPRYQDTIEIEYQPKQKIG